MQKEEAEMAINKKIKAKKMLDEIFNANKKAILVKQQRALEIKEEEGVMYIVLCCVGHGVAFRFINFNSLYSFHFLVV